MQNRPKTKAERVAYLEGKSAAFREAADQVNLIACVDDVPIIAERLEYRSHRNLVNATEMHNYRRPKVGGGRWPVPSPRKM